MVNLTKVFSLSALIAMPSASAVTFINNSGERVILRDFTFTHKREIALKPIVLQNNSYYENSEIESCIADLKTESITFGTLKPECFVYFDTEIVRVEYPFGEAKKGVLDGTWSHYTLECMKLMQERNMQL